MNNTNDLTGELPIKQIQLRDDLKRMLILWQIMRYNLECIRTSDTLKEWAQAAKDNKNKGFVDLRVIAGNHLNVLNAMILKIKATMRPVTWNAIMSTLTSEQVMEIDLLLNEITELKENAIEGITRQVKEAKIRAGIPLNDPISNQELIAAVETEEEMIWSCIEPAQKHGNPQDSDGYNEDEVYQAVKRMYNLWKDKGLNK